MMLVLFQALFTSCSDDKDEPEVPTSKASTYTVAVDFDFSQIAGTGVQTTTDLTFFEYNEKNEMVNYQDWKNAIDGTSRKFKASEHAKKLTIMLEVLANDGKNTATLKRYSAQVYYLKAGANTDINLDGTLRVVKYSPL